MPQKLPDKLLENTLLCVYASTILDQDMIDRENVLEKHNGLIRYDRKGPDMTMVLVVANVLGTAWAWIVWIVVGGIAGALADRLIQGDQLGIVGNIVVGIIGGLIGGVILGIFGIGGQGIIWTFITALLGAIILLWIVKAVTGGRGIRTRH